MIDYILKEIWIFYANWQQKYAEKDVFFNKSSFYIFVQLYKKFENIHFCCKVPEVGELE